MNWQKCVSLGIFLGCVFSGAAWADDPPSRAARLDYVDGAVTFAPAGSDNWAYAPVNRPMTTGDQLWVDQGAKAELHLGSTAVRLGDQTSLSFLSLNDGNTQLKLAQGTLNLRIRKLFDDDHVEVDTPNLAFVPKTSGDYRLDVDPNGNATTITVWHGEGSAIGAASNSYRLRDGDRVVYSGTDLIQNAASVNPYRDPFDNWAMARDQREDRSVSARYVSREVTGYQSLDDNGDWVDDPQYGHVWAPRVTIVNWAPYHYGHWVWVAPWGWTWVDDEPWGFAPFHYGRWAWASSRWCWVPGAPVVRPVYAPALVVFASGGGGGVNWSISLSSGGAGLAWFPLGPGEVYHPAYRVSPTYVNNVNNTVIVNKTVNVTNNITNITNVTKTVYVNQQAPNAVSAMSATAFVKGQTVQSGSAHIDAHQLEHAQFAASPGVAPVHESVIGAARAAPVAPRRVEFDRPVVAVKAPPAPAATHDDLARQFAEHGGKVEAAGPALIRNTPAVKPAAVLQAPVNAAPPKPLPSVVPTAQTQAVLPHPAQPQPVQAQPAQPQPTQAVPHPPGQKPAAVENQPQRPALPTAAEKPAVQKPAASQPELTKPAIVEPVRPTQERPEDRTVPHPPGQKPAAVENQPQRPAPPTAAEKPMTQKPVAPPQAAPAKPAVVEPVRPTQERQQEKTVPHPPAQTAVPDAPQRVIQPVTERPVVERPATQPAPRTEPPKPAAIEPARPQPQEHAAPRPPAVKQERLPQQDITPMPRVERPAPVQERTPAAPPPRPREEAAPRPVQNPPPQQHPAVVNPPVNQAPRVEERQPPHQEVRPTEHRPTEPPPHHGQPDPRDLEKERTHPQ
ncbi:DUF6600 domain-containing protein [Andreprevotia chitinilytica]|uniref:DUF6600 domain-containing protein n=1 Tax=Andreprevotia chitinilytica TaxID=396808 RepID=UPI00068D2220|nr:DUF6600 domain-containing protein [Andreprevotia chitinilytica]